MSIAIPGRSATVLVIDDEPAMLQMISAALESAGIAVLVAPSGEAALRQMEVILPDLIITDAMMPGMTGFETTTLIKHNPRLANIPVIFMTGLSDSEHVVEAFGVGGIDYVRKPVNIAELLARVRAHMAQGHSVQASMASLEATGRLMLAIDGAGGVAWSTPGADAAIARFVPGWSRESGMLPPELRGPFDRLIAKGGEVGSGLRIDPIFGESALEMVLIARYRDNEVLIRLTEINADESIEKLSQSLGLTRREAEVLQWVSFGKSSIDISEVLSISPRTVQKHLEHIYEKLGVETRSAAAAVAVRVIGQ